MIASTLVPFIEILRNRLLFLHRAVFLLTGNRLVLICLFALQIFSGFCFSNEIPAVNEKADASSAIAARLPEREEIRNTRIRYAGLLESCWSEGDLKGTPQEKVIRPSPAHKDGPALSRLRPNAGLPQLPQTWRNSIRRVQIPDGKKLIALTFDLCERENEVTGYDAEIVNCLRANRAKATFFASGKWMQSHRDRTMQLMTDPLFELGTHGWVHENFRLLSREEAEERFLWSQAQYEVLREELQKKCCPGDTSKEMENVPALPRVFRFPFGTCNAASLDMLAAHGVAAIQWDVVSGDPAKGQTAKGITEIVLKQSKPGSIVIFHGNGRGHGTSQALPGLIATLKSRGFEFATVSELLQAGTPVASPDCYELKPGDNLRYDKFK